MTKRRLASYGLNLVGVALLYAAITLAFTFNAFGKSTTYIQGICTTACYTIIMVTSLNLVVGFMGEFSMGHAGFVSVGAYVSAIVSGALAGHGLSDLALLLVAMGVYRSPAVALMPDVTPKPLRSRGNAVINLMGAVGGILYLALAAVLYPASRKVAGHVDYQPLFTIVSLIMAASVLVLALTVKEKKLSEENRALEKQHPDWNLAAKDESGSEVLPKEVKRSLTFLLASISLWFIAYNGVTTWFTKYIEQVMGEGLGGASTCLLVATAGAICSYIPIGALAAKIGRKRTIQLGVALLTLCFLLGFVLTCTSSVITPVMYVVFALVGLAWAAINVNSLPMVVEMCRGSDIGRFTGYYYTFSMVAQVVTPIAAGSLMRAIDYRVLFPYAAIFSTLSFVTMCFVRHGDAKAEAKKGLEAFEDMDVE